MFASSQHPNGRAVGAKRLGAHRGLPASTEALNLLSILPTLKDHYVKIPPREINGRLISIAKEPDRQVGRYDH